MGVCSLLVLALSIPVGAAQGAEPTSDRRAEIERQIEESRFDKAADLLQEALAETPDDLSLRLRLADVLAYSRDFQRAQTEYEKALDIAPDNLLARVGRARMRALLGKPDEAGDLLLALDKTNPDHPVIVRALGEIALWRADRAEAKRLFEKYLETVPDDYEIIESLANLYFADADYRKAGALYTRAKSLSDVPRLARALEAVRETVAADASRQALALAESGDFENAHAVLDKALAESPDAKTLLLARARVELRQSDTTGALETLARAQDLYPDDADVRIARAQALSLTGSHDDAIAALSQWVEENPDHAGARRALGEIAYRAGKAALSLRHLTIYLRTNPDDLEALMWVGNLHFAQGDLDQAEAAFRKVLALSPLDADALKHMSALEAARRRNVLQEVLTSQEAGDLSPTLPILEDLVSAEPDNLIFRQALAQTCAALGKHEDAARQYAIVLEKDKANTGVLVALARSLLVLGRIDDARAHVRKALDLDSENEPAKEQLLEIDRVVRRQRFSEAMDLVRAGQRDSAVDILREISSLEPGNVTYALALGEELFQSETPADALPVYREHLQKVPGDVAVRMKVADLLASQEQYEEALSQYQLILETAPTSEVEGRIAHVKTLRAGEVAREALRALDAGDLEKARAGFEEAVSLDPANSNYRLAVADIEGRLRQPERAADIYREILELDPHNLGAELGLIELRMEDGAYDECLSRLETLDKLHPDNPAVQRLLGDVYQRQGQARKALRHYKSYLSNAPSDYEVVENVADILNRPGSFANAAKLYRRVLELQPESPSALERLEDIQERSGFLLETGYEAIAVDTPGDNLWQIWTTRVTHLTLDGNAWWARAQFLERFSHLDTRIGLGGNYWLSEKAYLTGNVDFGLDNAFSSDFATDVEISFETVENLWAHLRYQFLDFPDTDVSIFSPALTWYFDKHSLHLRYFQSKDRERPGYGQSVLLQLQTRWSDSFDTSVGFAIGNRIFDIVGAEEARDEDGSTVFAGARFRFTKDLALRVKFAHSEEEPQFRSNTYGVSLEITF